MSDNTPELPDLRTVQAAYHADRRRAANAWLYYLSGEHFSENTIDGLNELIDSAEAEGRLRKLLLAVLEVARDEVPALRTAALSEKFAERGLIEARREADTLVRDDLQ